MKVSCTLWFLVTVFFVFVAALPPGDPTRWSEIILSSTSSGEEVRREGDTQVWVGANHVCHFDRVLANATHTVLFVADDENREALREAFAATCHYGVAYIGQRKPKSTTQALAAAKRLCECFNRMRMPIFAPLLNPAAVSKHIAGQVIGVDQFSPVHHHGHFIEALGMIHSLLREIARTHPQAELHLHFFKTSSFTGIEQSVAEIACQPMSASTAGRLVEESTFHESPRAFLWFDSVTISAQTNLIATSMDQANAYRNDAVEFFKLPAPAPPPRALILVRDNRPMRKMSNIEQVVETITARTGLVTDIRSMSGETTLRDQAILFREYSLIVSSHSSQLMAMLFARPGTVFVEVVPVLFNLDFANAARDLGLQYFLLVSGDPLLFKGNGPYSSVLQQAVADQRECAGSMACIRAKAWCADGLRGQSVFRFDRVAAAACLRLKTLIKRKDLFEADIAQLDTLLASLS
eukprot:m.64389 g.64389  ORF g.64389 m.64389 type:complete len:465 (+) comp12522_c0_seq1:52-1446(+)